MSSRSIRSGFETVIVMAHLLECVESGAARTSAEGYRQLVLQLQMGLSEDIPADTLQAILKVYPTAGELFENMHYERAGLFRAPVERSVTSELLAKQLLERVAQRVLPGR